VQWPLRVVVAKPGFGGSEVALPRQAFLREGDSLFHELHLTLPPVAKPAPADKRAETKPAPKNRRSSAPADKPPAKSAREDKAPSAAAPKAAPEDEKEDKEADTMGTAQAPGASSSSPEPAAPAAPAGKSAFDRALDCLSRGDNACVLAALSGSTGTRELDLLIETHRATGDGAAAEAGMRRYLELHPNGKRAAHYRRSLGIATP